MYLSNHTVPDADPGTAIGAIPLNGNGNGNGLLFHMTQPTSRSVIKAIACSKPIVSEH